MKINRYNLNMILISIAIMIVINIFCYLVNDRMLFIHTQFVIAVIILITVIKRWRH